MNFHKKKEKRKCKYILVAFLHIVTESIQVGTLLDT